MASNALRWAQFIWPAGRLSRLEYIKGLGLIGSANIGLFAVLALVPDAADNGVMIGVLGATWIWWGGSLMAARLRDARWSGWFAMPPMGAYAIGVADFVTQLSGWRPTDHELGLVVGFFAGVIAYVLAVVAACALPEAAEGDGKS